MTGLAPLDPFQGFPPCWIEIPDFGLFTKPYTRTEIESARVTYGNALANGTLARQPCERCGDPKTDGHHEDYTLPLVVNWLCRPHHARRHVELGWR